jgi:hypothetical protein
MINRFDKPHRVLPTYDIKKGLELFSMVARLDTHELLQHSLVNSIPLDVVNDMDENLIHEVVSIDPRKATDLNKLSVIKFLVTNGCNPDKPNKYNITPLHIACKQQLEEVVEYLLNIGCNPNYKDNMGLTPFHYLLTGNIKTIDKTTDVMDFVPPPRGVGDVDKMKELKAIKGGIWDLIKPKVIDSDEYPVLKTIQTTIDNIIIEDKIIANRLKDTTSKISTLIQNPANNDNVKESIVASMKGLEKAIKDKFGGFNDIDISIHPKEDKEDMSWSPLGDDTELSLIRNGKVKKVIKREMQKLNDEIKLMAKSYTPLNIPSILSGGALEYNDIGDDITKTLDIMVNTINMYNTRVNNHVVTIHTFADAAAVEPVPQAKITSIFDNLYNLKVPDYINDLSLQMLDNIRKMNDIEINKKYYCVFTIITNIKELVEQNILDTHINYIDPLMKKMQYLINNIDKIPNIQNINIPPPLDPGRRTSINTINIYALSLRDAVAQGSEIYTTMINLINNLTINPPATLQTVNSLVLNNIQNNNPVNIRKLIADTNKSITSFCEKLVTYWDAKKISNKVFRDCFSVVQLAGQPLQHANPGQQLYNLITPNQGQMQQPGFASLERFNTTLFRLKYEPEIQQAPPQPDVMERTKGILGEASERVQNVAAYETIKGLIITLINLIIANQNITNNGVAEPINYAIQLIKNIYNIIPLQPSSEMYLIHMIGKISETQQSIETNINRISTGISNLLINGDSSKLKDIYTNWYRTIANESKIVSFYKELYTSFINNMEPKYKDDNSRLVKIQINQFDYNELAEKLNKLNSNYYLYYYLFSPHKLIQLSRFNYYQIDIENPANYKYYEEGAGAPGDLLNILNVDSDNDTADATIGELEDNNETNYDDPTQKIFFKTLKPLQLGGDYFKKLKTSKLPPSLDNALSTFYEYSMKMLIKQFITIMQSSQQQLQAPPPQQQGRSTPGEILDRVNKLRSNLGYNVKVKEDLSSYEVIAKMIQELIKEQIMVYVNNKVISLYEKEIAGVDPNQITKFKESIINKVFPVDINVYKTDVNILENITHSNQIENLYPLMAKLDKNENEGFVLYPNDFTNLNRLKSKYGMANIKSAIIELMLQYGGSPYNTNNEGRSPIYSIILNHNHPIIKTLAIKDINFNTFADEKPKEFLIQQIKNNIHKVFGKYNKPLNEPMKNIFSNINSYLYNDVKSTILSNESFGNNIITHLENSFHLSTYLTLQFLSEHLLDTNTQFTITDAKDLLSDYIIKSINANFLFKKINNIPALKTYCDFDILVIIKIIKEIKSKITKLKIDKKMIDDTLVKFNVNSSIDNENEFYYKIYNSSKRENIDKELQQLSSYYTKLNLQIRNRKPRKLKQINSFKMDCYKNANDKHIIDRYNTNIHNGVMLEAWSKLFNLSSVDNYNLIPLDLLRRQSKILKDNEMDKLKELNKAFGHYSRLAEDYFNTEKYTSSNKFLAFIEDMLVYICKLVFGTSIEYMMRRILFTHFNQSTDNMDDITDRIETIMNASTIGTNLKYILYCEVCPELVRTSAEIFKSRAHEQAEPTRPVRDILSNFFKLLDRSLINLDKETKNVFTKNVTPYLDSFISKSILLWYVNVENILKFFINNYRATESLIELK